MSQNLTNKFKNTIQKIFTYPKKFIFNSCMKSTSSSFYIQSSDNENNENNSLILENESSSLKKNFLKINKIEIVHHKCIIDIQQNNDFYEVKSVLDNVVDDVVTNYLLDETSQDYIKNITEFYLNQNIDISNNIKVIENMDELKIIFDKIKKYRINHTLLEYDEFFKTIKTYKDNQFCGVFKTDNYIIRVDNNADQFKCELNIMFALGKGLIKNHNIVLPIYVKIDTRTRRKSSLHFSIQPRIKNCETLQDWLSRFENKCKQTEYFISMCIKCCKMVQNLHKHHLVHGDIKPDNILIDLSNDEMYLIDFGLSGLHKLSEGTGGTKPYCSPLSLNANLNEKYIWTKNSKYNDVWSIALIFLCIIIFKRVFSYYCHFPTYFFNDDFYVSSYYLNKIPSHYRTPFELVLTKNNISIETFIYLLENSLITKKNCFVI